MIIIKEKACWASRLVCLSGSHRGFHYSLWEAGSAALGMLDLAALQEVQLDQTCPLQLSGLLYPPMMVQDLSLVPGRGKLVDAVC